MVTIPFHNPHLSDPDVLLMLEFQKGSEVSFETLMHKYYSRILNFIYRFSGRDDIAEDLAQKVFREIYHASPSFNRQSKLQTWIFRGAYQIVVNELKRSKKPLGSSSMVPAAILALPSDQRAAVVLSRYAKFSYEEIAAIMGCPVATIQFLLNQAKASLLTTLAIYVKD